MRKLWLCLACLLWPLLALAQDTDEPTVIVGPAMALDGNTLQMDGTRIRLFGIVAPEMQASGGPQSRAVLDDLIGNSEVRCEVTGKARDLRAVAVCIASGLELSEAMLRRGAAVVFRFYTRAKDADPARADRYDAAERAARLEGAGVWQSASGEVGTLLGLAADWWQAIAIFAGPIGAGLLAILAALVTLGGIRKQIRAADERARSEIDAADRRERERRFDDKATIARAFRAEFHYLMGELQTFSRSYEDDITDESGDIAFPRPWHRFKFRRPALTTSAAVDVGQLPENLGVLLTDCSTRYEALAYWIEFKTQSLFQDGGPDTDEAWRRMAELLLDMFDLILRLRRCAQAWESHEDPVDRTSTREEIEASLDTHRFYGPARRKLDVFIRWRFRELDD